MRQRESLIGVAWGARPKPGPASPANVSKRGLSARLYVPNQTLILVNARLPKGNSTAGNRGKPDGYGEREPGFPGSPKLRTGRRLKTAALVAASTLAPSLRATGARECAPRWLAMTAGYGFTISRLDTPELCQKFPCPRKLRAQGRPGARCTRGLVCNVCKKLRTRAYRFSGDIRPSLRNGFTAYFALSPVSPALLPPSSPRSVCFSRT